MTSGRVARAVTALLLIGAGAMPLHAAEPIPAEAKLVPAPAIRTGTLANGMRYAVVRNGTPRDAVSIRLLLKVGSFDEGDDERGFAHFIEHLAFRSTRHAPGGVLDNRYAALGVTLGQDHNAFTTLDSTIYRIDLPGSAPDGVQQVLEWLRDATDGIAFTQEAVDVERRVLEAEARSRNTALARVQRASSEFMGPTLRATARDPIGTPETLAAATPGALKAFHGRWYRPDKATLVVSGAIDPDAIIVEIERRFATWEAIGAAPERAAPPKSLPERAADSLVVVEPNLPATLTACRLAPLDGDRTPSLERVRRDLLGGVWTRILNARLAKVSTTPGSGLLGSGVVTLRDGPEARMTCLIALPAEGRWKESLAGAQAELRRFASESPTAQEVEEAVGAATIDALGAAYEADSSPSSTLADQIVAAELTGRVIETKDETIGTMGLAAAGVEPADVKAAFAHDWAGAGPFVTATLPAAIDKAELLAAWQANERAKPLDAYVERTAPRWDYDFGRKGKVRKRTVFADPGFVRLEYENGLVLNYKHTDFSAGAVEVRLSLGHGLTGLPPEMRAPMTFGAGLVTIGGLGRIAADDIEASLGLTNWEFDFEPDTHSWMITDRASSGVVDKQMELLAAFVSDPGFRPLIDEKVPTVVDIVYRMAGTDPSAVAGQAFEAAVFPSLRSYPEPEQLLRWRAADYARVLKPILTGAPIELTVVGDIKEKALRRIVAKTLGALPKRTRLAPVAGPGPFWRFPDAPPAPVKAVHQGGTGKAAAMMVWPLFVASPARRSEEYALQLLGAVFRDRLIQRARMELGIVYSPAVVMNSPDDADQGYLSARFESKPEDLDRLIAAARAIAADLVAGNISEKELSDAREPMRADGREALTRNATWADALSESARGTAGIEELMRFDALLAAVTVDDLRRAAATWLVRPPIVSTALAEPGGAAVPIKPAVTAAAR
ncbi:insulinase family protein [Sphingomonas parva]|uniref:Insulinase family protein n=1 Tax=Sphingomonas parva TaxID=2555898 RepID=A0A4Y8ZQL6_9SPHN|nr:M16 family metallopeptidase [Sphingomonas parva]TFI56686.1 insulinase family protein [Sphingomonas parva]